MGKFSNRISKWNALRRFLFYSFSAVTLGIGYVIGLCLYSLFHRKDEKYKQISTAVEGIIPNDQKGIPSENKNEKYFTVFNDDSNPKKMLEESEQNPGNNDKKNSDEVILERLYENNGDIMGIMIIMYTATLL